MLVSYKIDFTNKKEQSVAFSLPATAASATLAQVFIARSQANQSKSDKGTNKFAKESETLCGADNALASLTRSSVGVYSAAAVDAAIRCCCTLIRN